MMTLAFSLGNEADLERERDLRSFRVNRGNGTEAVVVRKTALATQGAFLALSLPVLFESFEVHFPRRESTVYFGLEFL